MMSLKIKFIVLGGRAREGGYATRGLREKGKREN